MADPPQRLCREGGRTIEHRLVPAAQHLHRLTAGVLAAAGQPGHPAELLQHLLHLHELLEQPVHIFH